MSSITVEGFQSSAIFAQIDETLKNLSDAERLDQVKKVKAVFVFNVKNKDGKTATWTLDLKNGKGALNKGVVGKADATIDISDADFVALSEGKANGQKLFMSGKLKVKGAVMLATKLDSVLNAGKDKAPKAKL
ncbi:hypothetical protein BGZ96_001810 [Linnemannia gamsii]|uniref:SCP2 domain-containing protein n=1 Tax=Linnemannia gamsii TaxID=64522 RepID=A0ABQ7JLT9_9FUNG|nr:hypothetical protein BGZ96_001810 [Linnemannia gamsii]